MNRSRTSRTRTPPEPSRHAPIPPALEGFSFLGWLRDDAGRWAAVVGAASYAACWAALEKVAGGRGQLLVAVRGVLP